MDCNAQARYGSKNQFLNLLNARIAVLKLRFGHMKIHVNALIVELKFLKNMYPLVLNGVNMQKNV